MSPRTSHPDTHDPMRPHALEVRGLRKAYGDHVVLDDLDLTVDQGSVHALLGANGAGKTTLVSILCTLVRPDAGEVTVLGHDLRREPSRVRREIALTGQFSAVDSLLTGRENLRLMADLAHLDRRAGRDRVQHLLERFDLTDAADRRAATYSGGMVRRLDLAMTLVGRPRLVFLDEPTTGLDPRSRRQVWDAVRELVADGVTVLLTTQYLEEADQLADRVTVLHGGRLVADGSPAELKRQVPGGVVRFDVADAAALDTARRAVPWARTHDDPPRLDVPSDGGLLGLRDVTARLAEAAVPVTAISTHEPDLDDVFFALTGEPAADLEEVR